MAFVACFGKMGPDDMIEIRSTIQVAEITGSQNEIWQKEMWKPTKRGTKHMAAAHTGGRYSLPRTLVEVRDSGSKLNVNTMWWQHWPNLWCLSYVGSLKAVSPLREVLLWVFSSQCKNDSSIHRAQFGWAPTVVLCHSGLRWGEKPGSKKRTKTWPQ